MSHVADKVLPPSNGHDAVNYASEEQPSATAAAIRNDRLNSNDNITATTREEGGGSLVSEKDAGEQLPSLMTVNNSSCCNSVVTPALLCDNNCNDTAGFCVDIASSNSVKFEFQQRSEKCNNAVELAANAQTDPHSHHDDSQNTEERLFVGHNCIASTENGNYAVNANVRYDSIKDDRSATSTESATSNNVNEEDNNNNNADSVIGNETHNNNHSTSDHNAYYQQQNDNDSPSLDNTASSPSYSLLHDSQSDELSNFGSVLEVDLLNRAEQLHQPEESPFECFITIAISTILTILLSWQFLVWDARNTPSKRRRNKNLSHSRSRAACGSSVSAVLSDARDFSSSSADIPLPCCVRTAEQIAQTVCRQSLLQLASILANQEANVNNTSCAIETEQDSSIITAQTSRMNETERKPETAASNNKDSSAKSNCNKTTEKCSLLQPAQSTRQTELCKQPHAYTSPLCECEQHSNSIAMNALSQRTENGAADGVIVRDAPKTERTNTCALCSTTSTTSRERERRREEAEANNNQLEGGLYYCANTDDDAHRNAVNAHNRTTPATCTHYAATTTTSTTAVIESAVADCVVNAAFELALNFVDNDYCTNCNALATAGGSDHYSLQIGEEKDDAKVLSSSKPFSASLLASTSCNKHEVEEQILNLREPLLNSEQQQEQEEEEQVSSKNINRPATANLSFEHIAASEHTTTFNGQTSCSRNSAIPFGSVFPSKESPTSASSRTSEVSLFPKSNLISEKDFFLKQQSSAESSDNETLVPALICLPTEIYAGKPAGTDSGCSPQSFAAQQLEGRSQLSQRDQSLATLLQFGNNFKGMQFASADIEKLAEQTFSAAIASLDGYESDISASDHGIPPYLDTITEEDTDDLQSTSSGESGRESKTLSEKLRGFQSNRQNSSDIDTPEPPVTATGDAVEKTTSKTVLAPSLPASTALISGNQTAATTLDLSTPTNVRSRAPIRSNSRPLIFADSLPAAASATAKAVEQSTSADGNHLVQQSTSEVPDEYGTTAGELLSDAICSFDFINKLEDDRPSLYDREELQRPCAQAPTGIISAVAEFDSAADDFSTFSESSESSSPVSPSASDVIAPPGCSQQQASEAVLASDSTIIANRSVVESKDGASKAASIQAHIQEEATRLLSSIITPPFSAAGKTPIPLLRKQSWPQSIEDQTQRFLQAYKNYQLAASVRQPQSPQSQPTKSVEYEQAEAMDAIDFERTLEKVQSYTTTYRDATPSGMEDIGPELKPKPLKLQNGSSNTDETTHAQGPFTDVVAESGIPAGKKQALSSSTSSVRGKPLFPPLNGTSSAPISFIDDHMDDSTNACLPTATQDRAKTATNNNHNGKSDVILDNIGRNGSLPSNSRSIAQRAENGQHATHADSAVNIPQTQPQSSDTLPAQESINQAQSLKHSSAQNSIRSAEEKVDDIPAAAVDTQQSAKRQSACANSAKPLTARPALSTLQSGVAKKMASNGSSPEKTASESKRLLKSRSDSFDVADDRSSSSDDDALTAADIFACSSEDTFIEVLPKSRTHNDVTSAGAIVAARLSSEILSSSNGIQAKTITADLTKRPFPYSLLYEQKAAAVPTTMPGSERSEDKNDLWQSIATPNSASAIAASKVSSSETQASAFPASSTTSKAADSQSPNSSNTTSDSITMTKNIVSSGSKPLGVVEKLPSSSTAAAAFLRSQCHDYDEATPKDTTVAFTATTRQRQQNDAVTSTACKSEVVQQHSSSSLTSSFSSSATSAITKTLFSTSSAATANSVASPSTNTSASRYSPTVTAVTSSAAFRPSAKPADHLASAASSRSEPQSAPTFPSSRPPLPTLPPRSSYSSYRNASSPSYARNVLQQPPPASGAATAGSTGSKSWTTSAAITGPSTGLSQNKINATVPTSSSSRPFAATTVATSTHTSLSAATTVSSSHYKKLDSVSELSHKHLEQQVNASSAAGEKKAEHHRSKLSSASSSASSTSSQPSLETDTQETSASLREADSSHSRQNKKVTSKHKSASSALAAGSVEKPQTSLRKQPNERSSSSRATVAASANATSKNPYVALARATATAASKAAASCAIEDDQEVSVVVSASVTVRAGDILKSADKKRTKQLLGEDSLSPAEISALITELSSDDDTSISTAAVFTSISCHQPVAPEASAEKPKRDTPTTAAATGKPSSTSENMQSSSTARRVEQYRNVDVSNSNHYHSTPIYSDASAYPRSAVRNTTTTSEVTRFEEYTQSSESIKLLRQSQQPSPASRSSIPWGTASIIKSNVEAGGSNYDPEPIKQMQDHSITETPKYPLGTPSSSAKQQVTISSSYQPEAKRIEPPKGQTVREERQLDYRSRKAQAEAEEAEERERSSRAKRLNGPQYLSSEHIQKLLEEPYYVKSKSKETVFPTAPTAEQQQKHAKAAESSLPLSEKNLRVWSSMPENTPNQQQHLMRWRNSMNLDDVDQMIDEEEACAATENLRRLTNGVVAPVARTTTSSLVKEHRTTSHEQRSRQLLRETDVDEETESEQRLRRSNRYKTKIDKAKKDFLVEAKGSVSDLYKPADEFERKFNVSMEDVLRKSEPPRGPLLEAFHSPKFKSNIDLSDLKLTFIPPAPLWDEEYNAIVAKAERLWGAYKKRVTPPKEAMYAHPRSFSTGYLETDVDTGTEKQVLNRQIRVMETDMDEVHKSRGEVYAENAEARAAADAAAHQSRTRTRSVASMRDKSSEPVKEHSRARSMDYISEKRAAKEAIEIPENQLKKILGSDERQLSEHELRFKKSLEKLHIPDWYLYSESAGQKYDAEAAERRSRRSTPSGYQTVSDADASYPTSPEPAYSPVTPTHYGRMLPGFSATACRSATAYQPVTRSTPVTPVIESYRKTTTTTITSTLIKSGAAGGKQAGQLTSILKDRSMTPSDFSPSLKASSAKDHNGEVYLPSNIFSKYKDEIEELRKSRTTLHSPTPGENESSDDSSSLPAVPVAHVRPQQLSQQRVSSLSDQASPSPQPPPIPLPGLTRGPYPIAPTRSTLASVQHPVASSTYGPGTSHTAPHDDFGANVLQTSTPYSSSQLPRRSAGVEDLSGRQPIAEVCKPVPPARQIPAMTQSVRETPPPIPSRSSHPPSSVKSKASVAPSIASQPASDVMSLPLKRIYEGWTVTAPTLADMDEPRSRNSRVIEVADTFFDTVVDDKGNRVLASHATIDEVLDNLLGLQSHGAGSHHLSVLEDSTGSNLDLRPQTPTSNILANSNYGPVFIQDQSLMQKCINKPHLAEELLKSERIWIRCQFCGKVRERERARARFVTCKNCYLYYCCRTCRRSDWNYHRETCTFARISTLCKEVIIKVRNDTEAQWQMSRVARQGYGTRGRGSVNFRFRSPRLAEIYVEGGWSDLQRNPGNYLYYFTIQDLIDGGKDKNLINLCRRYDPRGKFILSVSVITDIDDCPETPEPDKVSTRDPSLHSLSMDPQQDSWYKAPGKQPRVIGTPEDKDPLLTFNYRPYRTPEPTAAVPVFSRTSSLPPERRQARPASCFAEPEKLDARAVLKSVLRSVENIAPGPVFGQESATGIAATSSSAGGKFAQPGSGATDFARGMQSRNTVGGAVAFGRPNGSAPFASASAFRPTAQQQPQPQANGFSNRAYEASHQPQTAARPNGYGQHRSSNRTLDYADDDEDNVAESEV